MKKFEANCPVDGTSALQPIYCTETRHARIIAFPQARDARRTPRAGTGMASTLRNGTAQGLPFGRVQRWQAIVGGCVYAALALASIVIGW